MGLKSRLKHMLLKVIVDSASLELLHGILVLCNLYPATEQPHYTSQYYCAGARQGSQHWVRLPPRYQFLNTRRESMVVDNTMVIIGQVVQQFRINQEQVTTGDRISNTPEGDLGGCSVYDKPSNRILHISAGEVRELQPGLAGPYTVISTSFIPRWMIGCYIADLGGRRSVVVAGGHPVSPEDGWLDYVSTVEYLPLEDLVEGSNKAPSVLPPTRLSHSAQPGITQVGEDLVVVGGGEVTAGRRSCVERWTGRDWQVMDLDCYHLGIGRSPLVTFVPRDFCDQ